jgi:hypothetical protein
MSIYKSPLVCCTICRKELSAKGIHSHYISAHTIEGNLVRKQCGSIGGKKIKPKVVAKNKSTIDNYNLNPSICQQCNSVLPYEKRHNKFCCSSCSATFNNKKRYDEGYRVSEKNKLKATETLKLINKIKSENAPKFTKVSCCLICNKWFIGTRKTCSDSCKRKVFSITATNNPKMGGNKNNKAYGWYTSPSAGAVWLESSYEYKVAKSLDDNNINWIRPPYISYNETKKYFPDFYLPDYDVYLDPKNDYLIEMDRDKIQSVMEQNSVIVIIIPKDKLNWKSIHAEILNWS